MPAQKSNVYKILSYLHLKTVSHKHLWKEVGIENKNITKLFTSLIALKNCTYYRKVVVRCNVEHSW